jgi:DHA2 family multidrug resistance protein-like MFS transporter
MTTTLTPQLRAGRREWAGLAVLMIPVLLISIDNTVLGFAIPAISTGLHPTGTQLLWIVDIYALMLAGLLVAMGSLGDRLGRRKLLLIGSAGFGAASLLAAFSTSAEMLIIARALLGVFGATLMPSTLSLIRNIFDHEKDRRIAIATWAAMFSGGAALGPILGGFLLEHFHWSSIFFINLPLIALFIPAAALLLPESRDPNPGRFDPFSIILSMLTLAPLVFSIKHSLASGADILFWASLSVAIIAGVSFVLRQLAAANPMLDVRLFANSVFTSAVVSNLLSVMGLAGFLYFGTQLLQLVLGLSPVDAALRAHPRTHHLGRGRLPRGAADRPLRTARRRSMRARAQRHRHGHHRLHLRTLRDGNAAGLPHPRHRTRHRRGHHERPHPRRGPRAQGRSRLGDIGNRLRIRVRHGHDRPRWTLDLHVRIRAAVRDRGQSGQAQFDTLGSALEYASGLSGAAGERITEAAVTAFDFGVQWAAGAAVVLVLIAAVLTSIGLKGAGRLLPGAAAGADSDR